MKRLILLLGILILVPNPSILAQEEEGEKKEPPSFMDDSAEEDYSYLGDEETTAEYERMFAQDLKFIPLGRGKNAYLTLGGQYRPRFESTLNENYTEEDDTYYSQRLNLHGNLHLGKNVRVFVDLFHGLTSGEGDRALEDDELAFHQAYVEFMIPNKENHFLFTFGRKQLDYGAGRLVSRRDGPNMRRSFDLLKTDYVFNSNTVEVFYGKEVQPDFDVFDNDFALFDSGSSDPTFWGVYSDFKVGKILGKTELYYLGFHSDFSSFSDVSGEETRHSIGIRRYGTVGKRMIFNTELVYQFGELGDATISAFNFEFDYKYVLIYTPWKPTFGLKFDFSSGDRDTGDDKLNTYSPLFVNPALYSLAAVNTPVNLNGLHPNFKIYPFKDFSIYMDYAFFFRSSKDDGLYTPPRFQIRTADSGSSAYIGSAIGMKILYEINRNIEFEWRSTYFIAGDFIKESGESNNIFYTGPTLEFKF
ncbi:MAG: alginate export family protein [Bacteroidota bacterium]